MNITDSKARQSAYADDLTGAGTINELKRWWDLVVEYGPYIGYYAKPEKSWLIVKREHFDRAKEVFKDSGLRITIEGRRHLGATIGSKEYKTEYVENLIDTWINELNELSKIAKIEPHLAYTAYIFGFQHKYTFFMRTIPNIEHQLYRLDEAINDFIMYLLNNYWFTDLERLWFSLPTRMGGLGIIIPSQLSGTYYKNSKEITAPLVNGIINQHNEAELEEECNPQEVKDRIRAEKKKREEEKLEFVNSKLDPQKQRILEATTEKGASSWLNSMPLKKHNFYLNKQLFWDSLYLRYGIPMPRLPSNCVCGTKFSIEYALTCKKGGFILILRHNDLRDFTAEILDEIYNDVAVEPLLNPLTGERFNYKTAITEDHARLDLSARGVFVKGSRAFFDLRVFNPLAQFYSKSTIKAAHKTNENMKKREYGERVLQVEQGSFTWEWSVTTSTTEYQTDLLRNVTWNRVRQEHGYVRN